MFRFAWRGAISSGRRRGNKWVYIAAGVDGRRWEEEVRGVQAGWRFWTDRKACRILGKGDYLSDLICSRSIWNLIWWGWCKDCGVLINWLAVKQWAESRFRGMSHNWWVRAIVTAMIRWPHMQPRSTKVRHPPARNSEFEFSSSGRIGGGGAWWLLMARELAQVTLKTSLTPKRLESSGPWPSGVAQTSILESRFGQGFLIFPHLFRRIQTPLILSPYLLMCTNWYMQCSIGARVFSWNRQQPLSCAPRSGVERADMP